MADASPRPTTLDYATPLPRSGWRLAMFGCMSAAVAAAALAFLALLVVYLLLTVP